MKVQPKFSQQRFDHMRHLIHSVKERAAVRNDVAASCEAELLDVVLLLFVEDLIGQDKIVVRSAQTTRCEFSPEYNGR